LCTLQQFPDTDWLHLEAVEPSGHDPLSVLGHYRCGNGDDGDGPGRGVGSKPPQGFDATDPGQLDVHQDEYGLPLARQADALFAGLGLHGLVALDLEHVSGKLPVLFVVFDNEDQLIRHDVPES
jgi:hypothetical protein